MRDKKNGPANAGASEANVLSTGRGQYNGNGPETQGQTGALRQYVTGLNAPLHLLASRGEDPPRVFVHHEGGRTWVGMECRPWGWPSIDREFIASNPETVAKYAFDQARRLATAANAKAEDIARRRKARWAERNGLPIDWEGGND